MKKEPPPSSTTTPTPTTILLLLRVCHRCLFSSRTLKLVVWIIIINRSSVDGWTHVREKQTPKERNHRFLRPLPTLWLLRNCCCALLVKSLICAVLVIRWWSKMRTKIKHRVLLVYHLYQTFPTNSFAFVNLDHVGPFPNCLVALSPMLLWASSFKSLANMVQHMRNPIYSPSLQRTLHREGQNWTCLSFQRVICYPCSSPEFLFVFDFPLVSVVNKT